MNRKQVLILLALVVVLGGAGLFLNQREKASWTSSNESVGKKVLGDFSVNEVTEIVIKHDTNSLSLFKKKDDVWRVRERKDYPANYGSISDFLLKAKDLKVVQSEQVGPSQLPRLALAQVAGTNGATVVEFKNADGKAIRELWLGKKHMRKSEQPSQFGGMGEEGWPDGRYIKTGGGASSVLLVSEPFENVTPKPEEWISKDFFKVDKIRQASVDYAAATNSWKLSRETESGTWKLADIKNGEAFDPGKASSLNGALSSPTINDVVVDPNLEALGLAKPTVVDLETFAGFHYSLKVGTKTNNAYPLMVSVSASLPTERTVGKDEKAEDKAKLDKEFQDKQKTLTEKLAQEKALENWVFLVSSWALDSLLKERHQLMVEKKETPKDDAENKPEEPAELVPDLK